MRKLKKLLAAVLAGTMVITSLTGCGGSGSSSKGPLTIEQIKKNGKLIVATEAAYEPFEYLDKDGETIIGYNADLFKDICDDLGVELDYMDVPFQGILAGLEAKKYDIVGATLGITKERADKYTMTVPIQKGTTAFIKKKGNDNIKTPEDMEGKVVGTQTSCYNEPDVKAYNEKLISNGGKGYKELKTYDGFPDAYMELKNGKLDLVAQNYASLAALVKNNPDDYEFVEDGNGNPAMVSDTDTWLSWAVRKSDTELSDYINSEIKKFKKDGTLDKLQKKWFGQTVELPDKDYIPEK